MLPNWSALSGPQDHLNQDEENLRTGEAAPAIDAAAHAEEAAQAARGVADGVDPTQGIAVPTAEDPLHEDTNPLRTLPVQPGTLAGYVGPRPSQTN